MNMRTQIYRAALAALLFSTGWMAVAAEPINTTDDEVDVCQPFLDGRVDSSLLETMLSAAENGHLYRIQQSTSRMGFCVHTQFSEIEGEFKDFRGGLALQAVNNDAGLAMMVIKTASVDVKGKLIESVNVKAAGGRPYSPAMRVGDYLYISGQVPIDGSGNTVGPGDPAAQTRQCFENIRELVEAAGATMEDVFWLTSYVTDIRVFMDQPQIRTEFFSPPYPASTVVQISSLAQPGWMIEIEARAYLGA